MSCFHLTLAKKVFCLLAAFAGRVKVHPCRLFQAREHPPTPHHRSGMSSSVYSGQCEVSASFFVPFSSRPTFKNDLIVPTGGLLHGLSAFWAGECLQTTLIVRRTQKLSRQQRVSEYSLFLCSFLLIMAKNIAYLQQQFNLHVLFDFCADACFSEQ